MMSMNETSVVGGSFEDLSSEEMAMLTGRGDEGVAPASTLLTPATPATGEIVATVLISIQVCANSWQGKC